MGSVLWLTKKDAVIRMEKGGRGSNLYIGSGVRRVFLGQLARLNLFDFLSV